MNPDSNSLETGYDSSAYSSSLEGSQAVPSSTTGSQPVQKVPYKARRLNIPLFKLNRTAFFITATAVVLVMLVGGVFLLYDKVHHNKNLNTTSTEASGTYDVGSSLSVQKASDSALLQVGQINKLEVNGQLKVSNGLVLTPTSAPTTAVPGQIYYNQTTDQPYYYNGSSFVSLVPAAIPEHVTSLGGSAGTLGLGSGLSINGGNLSISSSVLQSLSSVPNSPVVDSIQGVTGNVSFVAGPGISLNGTTISNGGVVSLNAGAGINVTNDGSGAYSVALVGGSTITSLNNDSGAISLGNGLSITANGGGGYTLANSGVTSITGTADEISVTPSGTGDITLSLPQAIGTTDDVTFNNGTLNGTLGVGQLASFSDGINVTGTTNLQATTDSSTLGVDGTLTVGDTTETGNIDLTNVTNNSDYVDLQTESQTAPLTLEIPTDNSGESTDYVCLEYAGNCGGSPDTVTSSSTTTTVGAIAEYTGSGDQIEPSTEVQDTGSDFDVNEGLYANSNVYTSEVENTSGDLALHASSNLSVDANSGSGKLTLEGNSTSYLEFYQGGNDIELTSPGTISSDADISLPDTAGTVCLTASSGQDCGYALAGSGVTTLNDYQGDICLQNATNYTNCPGDATSVAIQDAGNANTPIAGDLGLAEFNSNDFYVDDGDVDTVQGITTSSNVQFSSLSVTPSNCGGISCASDTIYADNYSSNTGNATIDLNYNTGSGNTDLFTVGSNSFEFPTNGGANQQICTSGVNCVAAGSAVLLQPSSSGASSAQTDTGTYIGINVNEQTGGTADLLQLATAGNPDLVIDNSGNSTFYNTTTVASLDTNSITPTSDSTALDIGSDSDNFALQGNESSTISVNDGSGNSIGVGYGYDSAADVDGVTDGSIYYAFDNGAAANSVGDPYFICTTAGNCENEGNSVTASDAMQGNIAYFSSTSGGVVIGSSILSEPSSTLVSVSGDLSVGDGGSNNQLTVGTQSSGAIGSIVLNNGTNSDSVTLKEATSNPSLTTPATISFPDTTGTVCLEGSSSCGFGVSGAGVTSVNTDTGAICLNYTTGYSGCSGTDLTLQNASTSQTGVVQIDSDGNLTFNSGDLDTAQGLQDNSNDTFSSLNLTGSAASTDLTLGTSTSGGNEGKLTFDDGTNDGFSQSFVQQGITVGNGTIDIPNLAGGTGTLDVGVSSSCGGSNMLSQSNGAVQITCSPNFSGSVTTPTLDGSSGLTVAPGGLFQLNTSSTTNAFNIYGDTGSSGSFLQGVSGSYSTKVDFDTPTATDTINFPTGYGGDICVQNTGTLVSNCSFAAAGNYINNTATSGTAQTSAQIDIQGDGTENIFDLYKSTNSNLTGTPDLYVDKSADLITDGYISATGTINGLTVSSGVISSPTISGTISGSSTPTITGFGTYNSQTISSAASFTGTVGVATSITIGSVGSTNGTLTLDSSNTGGSIALQSSTSQGNLTTVSFPTDSNSTDTVCLVTAANCTGSHAGSGDTSYIENQTTQQTNANIDIDSVSGSVAATIEGAASQNILNLLNSSGSTVADFTSTGELVVSGSDINGATITGGALSSTAVNGLTVSSGVISSPTISGTISGSSTPTITGFGTYNSQTISSAASFTGTVGVATEVYTPSIDTASSGGTLSIGTTNASTVNIGTVSGSTVTIGSSTTSTVIGDTLTVKGGNGTSTGDITTSVSSSVANSLSIQPAATSATDSGNIGAALNLTSGGDSYGSSTGGALSITAGSGSTNGGSIYLNAGTGGTSNGSINIGTNSVGSSTTSTIAIGGSTSTSVTFNTANIQVTTGGSKCFSTSTDTCLQLGSSSLLGNLVLADGTNSNTVSLSVGTTSSSYILELPTAAPTGSLSSTSSSSDQCLEDTTGSASTVDLAFGNCSNSHGKTIQLSAEYANAVLDEASDSNCNGTSGGTYSSAGAIGTMTSGYDPGSTTDGTPQNYYEWNSGQSTLECYDIVVQIPVPSDWASWNGAPTFYGETTSSSSVHVEFIGSNGSPDTASTANGNTGTGSGTACTGTGANGLGSDWCPLTFSGSAYGTNTNTLNYLTNADYTAGKTMILKIEMSTSSSGGGNAMIGDISIPYTTAY